MKTISYTRSWTRILYTKVTCIVPSPLFQLQFIVWHSLIRLAISEMVLDDQNACTKSCICGRRFVVCDKQQQKIVSPLVSRFDDAHSHRHVTLRNITWIKIVLTINNGTAQFDSEQVKDQTQTRSKMLLLSRACVCWLCASSQSTCVY